MGNGRVETASLPPGYMPLGSTEFGGIIYIVSYNPETNKCQVGSFPSPERNISSEENGQFNQITDSDFFEFIEETGYWVLKTEEKFYEILKDTILHPGDQFCIYGTNINNNLEVLNKNIKLTPVIKNDLGEYEELEVTEKFIPNSEEKYIIAEEWKNANNELDLDLYRNSITSFDVVTTKISGKLNIKAKVILPDSFTAKITNYNINSEEDILTLIVNFSQETSNEGVEFNKILINNEEKDFEDSISITIKNYSTESVINLNFIPIISFGEKLLVERFTISETIDVKKLGSGKIELSEWRYYNERNYDSLQLNFNLDSYVEPGKDLTDVVLNFIDYDKLENIDNLENVDRNGINPNSTYNLIYKDSLNNVSERINYSDLPKNKLYLAQFAIAYNNVANEESYYEKTESENGVKIEITNNIPDMFDGTLFENNIDILEIGENVTSIGVNALENVNINTLQIKGNLLKIGANAFLNSNIGSVEVESLESWLNIDFDNFAANPLNCGAELKILEITHPAVYNTEIELKIDDETNEYYYANVGKIKDFAFFGCNNLKNIYTESEIGHRSFNKCINLRANIIKENKLIVGGINFDLDGVVSIEEYAYGNMTTLGEISIPSSVQEIKPNAFFGCNNLKGVTITDKNTKIYKDSFKYISKGAIIRIPKDYEYLNELEEFDNIHYQIGSGYYYYDNSRIIFYDIKDSVLENYDPSNFEEIVLQNCKTTLNNSFTKITKLTLDNSTISVNDDESFKSLKIINIIENTTKFGTNCFKNSSNLGYVNYQGTLEQWCSIVFNNETSNPLHRGLSLNINNELQDSITLKEITINKYAFYGCNLRELNLRSVIINDHAFANCTGLKKLELPKSVTLNGTGQFIGCYLDYCKIYNNPDIEDQFDKSTLIFSENYNYNLTEQKYNIFNKDKKDLSITENYILDKGYCNIIGYYNESKLEEGLENINKGDITTLYLNIDTVPNDLIYEFPNLTKIIIGPHVQNIGSMNPNWINYNDAFYKLETKDRKDGIILNGEFTELTNLPNTLHDINYYIKLGDRTEKISNLSKESWINDLKISPFVKLGTAEYYINNGYIYNNQGVIGNVEGNRVIYSGKRLKIEFNVNLQTSVYQGRVLYNGEYYDVTNEFCTLGENNNYKQLTKQEAWNISSNNEGKVYYGYVDCGGQLFPVEENGYKVNIYGVECVIDKRVSHNGESVYSNENGQIIIEGLLFSPSKGIEYDGNFYQIENSHNFQMWNGKVTIGNTTYTPTEEFTDSGGRLHVITINGTKYKTNNELFKFDEVVKIDDIYYPVINEFVIIRTNIFPIIRKIDEIQEIESYEAIEIDSNVYQLDEEDNIEYNNTITKITRNEDYSKGSIESTYLRSKLQTLRIDDLESWFLINFNGSKYGRFQNLFCNDIEINDTLIIPNKIKDLKGNSLSLFDLKNIICPSGINDIFDTKTNGILYTQSYRSDTTLINQKFDFNYTTKHLYINSDINTNYLNPNFRNLVKTITVNSNKSILNQFNNLRYVILNYDSNEIHENVNINYLYQNKEGTTSKSLNSDYYILNRPYNQNIDGINKQNIVYFEEIQDFEFIEGTTIEIITNSTKFNKFLYRWLYTTPIFNTKYQNTLDFVNLNPKLNVVVDPNITARKTKEEKNYNLNYGDDSKLNRFVTVSNYYEDQIEFKPIFKFEETYDFFQYNDNDTSDPNCQLIYKDSHSKSNEIISNNHDLKDNDKIDYSVEYNKLKDQVEYDNFVIKITQYDLYLQIRKFVADNVIQVKPLVYDEETYKSYGIEFIYNEIKGDYEIKADKEINISHHSIFSINSGRYRMRAFIPSVGKYNEEKQYITNIDYSFANWFNDGIYDKKSWYSPLDAGILTGLGLIFSSNPVFEAIFSTVAGLFSDGYDQEAHWKSVMSGFYQCHDFIKKTGDIFDMYYGSLYPSHEQRNSFLKTTIKNNTESTIFPLYYQGYTNDRAGFAAVRDLGINYQKNSSRNLNFYIPKNYEQIEYDNSFIELKLTNQVPFSYDTSTPHGVLTHPTERGFVPIAGMFMLDEDDNPIPFNFFAYVGGFCKVYHSKDEDPINIKNFIIPLLTQLYMVYDPTNETIKKGIDVVGYDKSNKIYEFEYTITKKFDLKTQLREFNYEGISNSNIQPEYTIDGIEYKKEEDSTLKGIYKLEKEVQNLSDSLLEILTGNYYLSLLIENRILNIQTHNELRNDTLYWVDIFDSYKIKEIDGNFQLYDYIPEKLSIENDVYYYEWVDEVIKNKNNYYYTENIQKNESYNLNKDSYFFSENLAPSKSFYIEASQPLVITDDTNVSNFYEALVNSSTKVLLNYKTQSINKSTNVDLTSIGFDFNENIKKQFPPRKSIFGINGNTLESSKYYELYEIISIKLSSKKEENISITFTSTSGENKTIEIEEYKEVILIVDLLNILNEEVQGSKRISLKDFSKITFNNYIISEIQINNLSKGGVNIKLSSEGFNCIPVLDKNSSYKCDEINNYYIPCGYLIKFDKPIELIEKDQQYSEGIFEIKQNEITIGELSGKNISKIDDYTLDTSNTFEWNESSKIIEINNYSEEIYHLQFNYKILNDGEIKYNYKSLSEVKPGIQSLGNYIKLRSKDKKLVFKSSDNLPDPNINLVFYSNAIQSETSDNIYKGGFEFYDPSVFWKYSQQLILRNEFSV